MKPIAVVLCLLLLAGCGQDGQATTASPALQWKPLPQMPFGVLAAAISRSGDLAVITGGIAQEGLPAATVQLFDLRSLDWLPTLTLPLGRFDHAQVNLYDQRVLVIGGNTAHATRRAQPTAACHLIDPTTGEITDAAALPEPAHMLTAHLLHDGRVIALANQAAHIYDPDRNVWGTAIAFRRPRQAHASVLLDDGRVVVIGGMGEASIEVVDVQAKQSVRLPVSLPTTLDDLRAAALPGGRVWVIGGQESRSGHTTDQTWVLDLSRAAAPALTAGPRLGIPDGVADHCLVQFGRWLVVIGGESERNRQDEELRIARLLDTRDLSVHLLPDTSVPHDDAVAIADDEGVIVFGGFWEMPVAGSQRRLPIALRQVERLALPAMDPSDKTPGQSRRPRRSAND
jgi:hypothetical protein